MGFFQGTQTLVPNSLCEQGQYKCIRATEGLMYLRARKSYFFLKKDKVVKSKSLKLILFVKVGFGGGGEP